MLSHKKDSPFVVAASRLGINRTDSSPLLLWGNEADEYFSFTDKMFNLPGDTSQTYYDIGHSDQRYVISGLSFNKLNQANHYYPFLLESTDGESWEFIKTIDGFSQNQQEDVALGKVACNDSTCIAVGIHHEAPSTAPILLKSHAKLSWSKVIHTQLPEDLHTIGLYSVASNDKQFFAVGKYCDVKNNCNPLILSSDDNGESWSVSPIAAK